MSFIASSLSRLSGALSSERPAFAVCSRPKFKRPFAVHEEKRPGAVGGSFYFRAGERGT
ncbi:MAG TPA: hypothetical protein VEY11_19245 [Pyrinomonadaceae bacterium]|nr:hypothetical protein [Pyrinomonadaceae bacterium]